MWLAWSTFPGSGANVRAVYADGWLSFQVGGGEERRRLFPVSQGWDAASEDELRTSLRRVRPPGRAESLGGTVEVVAQKRDEEVADSMESDRAERTRSTPGALLHEWQRPPAVRKILREIRAAQDDAP